MPRADILMITYRSAGYLHLSLPRLLDTLGEDDRVWLWHNGDDADTLDVLAGYRTDPRVHRFHHSRENVRLREPTNWLWSQSQADFLSKVDDDCLVSPGWLDTFAAAHADVPELGVVGSWRHPEEDYRPELAHKKIRAFPGGHRLMLNHWVQGSGYLVGRESVERTGLLRADESFTGWCLRLAARGAVNGYYFPFVREDHMDDPRSPHTLVADDAGLQARMPLSAAANGVTTVEQWTAQLQRSALVLQTSSLDLRQYSGWRARVRQAKRRAAAFGGRPLQW